MPATPPPFAWSTPAPWTPQEVQRLKIPSQLDSHHDLSVPLGGIGAGGITRGVSGGFTRWTLKAGAVTYRDWPVNGFALWQAGHGARALRPDTDPGSLPWRFDPAGRHAALFPKAWHSYEDGALRLVIEQLSPIAPGLEADCDLPAGLFRAHLENTGQTPTDASVMLSFANLVGWFAGFNGIGVPGGIAGQRNRTVLTDSLHGVVMEQDLAGPPDEGQGQMLIGVAPAPGLDITTCPAFDPRREAGAFWDGFDRDGRVAAPGPDWVTGGGFSEFPAAQPGAAVAARVTLDPGETRCIDFALVWDLPVIRFGQSRRHFRHYTARWGRSGSNAQVIATHALSHVDRWSETIDTWHADLAESLDLPPEATALVVNALYFLTDGLAVWTDAGHFGLIECPDYPLYNTLDLWVYAAPAISQTFPELARAVTRAYGAEIARDDAEPRMHLRSDRRFARQRAGMAPHDLGAPNADPFHRANDYVYQDSALWKDLNAMFVLCAWRDVRNSPSLAAGINGPVQEAMTALAAFDRDGDGLIENDGFPDQTFDNIPMTGASAYCGGLWLAALRAAAAMAEAAGDDLHARRWRETGARGEAAFEETLWTGTCFRVDTGGRFSDAVFAEQLFGPASARMLGLGDCVDPQKARTALRHVWQKNFVETGGRGVMAVTSPRHDSSLYAPKGEEGLQWDEILIGFNASFAAALRAYGLEDECRILMRALADELGPKRGLHFRLPAALVPDRPEYRAQMNLRPLALWMLVEARAVSET